MSALLRAGVIVVCLGAAIGWGVTRPAPMPTSIAPEHQASAAAGEIIFLAAGCSSCHAAPGAKGEDKLVLTGGAAFPSDFGTFYAPNISPDRVHGIGGWTLEEFAHAVRNGVSPQGQHYYPAFPYAAYSHVTDADIADLFAYIRALPESDVPDQAHKVGFPFSIRRGLGVWKILFTQSDYVVTADLSEEQQRGRYLAEGLGHCAECHTPRNALGGLDRSRWMGGAPNPSGKGRIPNITPGALDWSQADLKVYFSSGLTPEYDSAGGEMAVVIENLSQLPEPDLAALAAYIKVLPAVK
jgi:mono/diheme cytochrome c family protein